jgi:hypothetical protein
MFRGTWHAGVDRETMNGARAAPNKRSASTSQKAPKSSVSAMTMPACLALRAPRAAAFLKRQSGLAIDDRQHAAPGHAGVAQKQRVAIFLSGAPVIDVQDRLVDKTSDSVRLQGRRARRRTLRASARVFIPSPTTNPP